MTFTTRSAKRDAELRRLRDTASTSVLIIGGGINGISLFRDLALQGVDVALVERGDFASGASAASSHMIHGGIRYLENGEFRLVRESVQERNELLKSAPHFVKPLKTTVPIYSTFSGILSAPLRFLTHRAGKPSERGAALIKTGLTIYDTFSRDGGSVPKHRFLRRRRALEDMPSLDPRIKYTATYFDASMHDPERLALDVLQDGRASNRRAVAVNYVEAVGIDGDTVQLLDHETASTFELKASVIVNTTGPWTDLTNEALGRRTEFMGGTKGSHIVLNHPELLRATKGREIFFEHSDGRIVLIYPLKNRVLVGTTDIDADPSEPAHCTDEEIDYFFDLIHHVFPTISVSRADIVFRFSGIRPLPKHEDTSPGFVSRDYRVEIDNSGVAPVLSLVGGKWTTFRALGATLSQRVLGVLGLERNTDTAGLRIGGGRDYPVSPTERENWKRVHLEGAGKRAEVLLERYGTRAAEVWNHIRGRDDAPLADGVVSTAELEWMVSNELVVRLEDVLLRRTSIAFVGDASTRVIQEIATALAPILGWDKTRTQAEISTTIERLNDAHGLSLVAPSHH